MLPPLHPEEGNLEDEFTKKENTDLFRYLLNDLFRQSIPLRLWCRNLIKIRLLLPDSTSVVVGMRMIHRIRRAHRRRRRWGRMMINDVHHRPGLMGMMMRELV